MSKDWESCKMPGVTPWERNQLRSPVLSGGRCRTLSHQILMRAFGSAS